ncbi:MAG: hypothetical protein RL069_586 [Planctomycetota bacterium]
MPTQVAWKLVYPTILLSIGLMAIGVVAAWNVHTQQRESSQAMAEEVQSLISLETANIECREIRYRMNMFLRTGDASNLQVIRDALPRAIELLNGRREKLSTASERELIDQTLRGLDHVSDEFSGLFETTSVSKIEVGASQSEALERNRRLTILADEVLTNEVLKPLEGFLEANQKYVEATNSRASDAAKSLVISFLLLGLCGGLSGTLIGLSAGRAFGRSMIQLSVSIRDAAVRLSDARGSITLTHQTDLPGLEVGVRKLAVDIEHVVAQLQQRERELSRSEQLARLGQLAAGMAHELRNPLMPMKILVQSAMEKEDGLQGRQLDVIHEEIQRLEKSIQAFLDFAKPPIPEKQVCSLSEIVRSTTELVRGRCVQQQVELVMSLPEASLNAYVDRNQICQLLLNLLLNSLDAMPEGGKLEVSLDTWLSSSNATVFKQNREEMLNQFHAIRSKVATTVSGLSETIPKKSYQQWMDLCVTDNGIGIDAHGMENLFLPFSTTKETGSGLGLATCDRIAQAHGGVIEVESQPGIRTLFRFSFPAPELPLS